MNPDNDFTKLLKHAVEESRPLEIMYQGHNRVVYPTLLGETASGRIVLHALQVAGSSKEGPVVTPSWKFLYCDQMASANLLVPSFPVEFKKSEGEYKRPGFIVKTLAMGKI
jgi:hypothetical protein